MAGQRNGGSQGDWAIEMPVHRFPAHAAQKGLIFVNIMVEVTDDQTQQRRHRIIPGQP